MGIGIGIRVNDMAPILIYFLFDNGDNFGPGGASRTAILVMLTMTILGGGGRRRGRYSKHFPEEGGHFCIMLNEWIIIVDDVRLGFDSMAAICPDLMRWEGCC